MESQNIYDQKRDLENQVPDNNALHSAKWYNHHFRLASGLNEEKNLKKLHIGPMFYRRIWLLTHMGWLLDQLHKFLRLMG